MSEEQQVNKDEPVKGSTENAENTEESVAAKPEKKKFIFLYIAIGCFALGTVALGLAIGLSYVVKGIGVYLLLTSMISEFCAMTFINAQKKMQKSKLCLVFTVLSYIVLFAAAGIMAAGTGFAACGKKQ